MYIIDKVHKLVGKKIATVGLTSTTPMGEVAYQFITTEDRGLFVMKVEPNFDTEQMIYDALFVGRVKYLIVNDDSFRQAIKILGFSEVEIDDLIGADAIKQAKAKQERIQEEKAFDKYCDALELVTAYEKDHPEVSRNDSSC